MVFSQNAARRAANFLGSVTPVLPFTRDLDPVLPFVILPFPSRLKILWFTGWLLLKPPPLKLKSAKCFSGGLISDQKFSKCWPGVLLLAKIWKSSKSDFLLDFPLDFLKFALKIPIFFSKRASRAYKIR